MYCEKAKNALNDLKESEAKKLLSSIAEYSIKREK
jgi:geranylgeranyl pyrophosphate synthase